MVSLRSTGSASSSKAESRSIPDRPYQTAVALLTKRLPAADLPVSLLRIGVSGLESQPTQLLLFDAEERQKQRQLAKDVPLHPAIAEIAGRSFRRRHPPEIKGSGRVVHSLEASPWAFHRAGSFEEAVLNAVNLGDDADTTGAVCGQFAGAYWGESEVPQRWRDGLARRDMIEQALQRIVTL